ncbi:MAG: hypothetical protein M9887_00850 [Chitinophagales bacterium]|nr:hypothetical protein [Chitinophagales bacterium]
MRNIVVILVCILQFYAVSGQDLNDKTLVDKNVVTASIDPLGQIFYINQSKQLIKLSKLQESPYIYSDLTINRNSRLITDNTFKTILYKKDIGDFLLLDNRLKLLSKSNFYDLGFFAVDALAISNDQKNIWIFDSQRQQLIQLNQQYDISYQSNNFTQYLSQQLQAVQITEEKQHVYLLDKIHGLYVFDNTAVFVKRLPIENADRFWLINNQIYFYRENTLWKYDTLLFEETPVLQLDKIYTSIDINRDYLIALTENGDLYRFPIR